MDPYQQQFVSDMQAMFDNILLWEKTCFNNSLEKWKSLNWDITTLYFKGEGSSMQILGAL